MHKVATAFWRLTCMLCDSARYWLRGRYGAMAEIQALNEALPYSFVHL